MYVPIFFAWLGQQSLVDPDLQTFQEVYVSPDLLLLARLDELIELHFREHKDPEFYCSQLAYTVRSLNEVIKLFRGKTVFRLIQERLLVEAKLVLCRCRMSAKLISYELGFEDPSYFGRFFRKMTGLSPQQFRKNCCSVSYDQPVKTLTQ